MQSNIKSKKKIYFLSCTLSKENVHNLIIGFYNDIQIRHNNCKGIIKKYGKKYNFIKSAVEKNCGLYFTHNNIDYYCYPLTPSQPDKFGFQAYGKNIIDVSNSSDIKSAEKYSLWLYLSIDDNKYYMIAKGVHDGCPVCKSMNFSLYTKNNTVKPMFEIKNLELEKSNNLDLETVWSLATKIKESDFRCQDCGEIINWNEIAQAYTLRWFVG